MRAARGALEEVVTSRAWAGFASGGRVRVRIEARKQPGPDPSQTDAVRFLRVHDAAVARAVLRPIMKAYPKLRAAHNAALGDEVLDDEDDAETLEFERSIGIRGPRRLPAIRTARALRDVIMLTVVHVLAVCRDDLAYVGFQFECDWDDEHGAGVLVHGTRVVASGQADVAFTTARALRDGGKPCDAIGRRAAAPPRVGTRQAVRSRTDRARPR